MSNKYDISVYGKIKLRTTGSPVVGYIIEIPKYSNKKLCITIEIMELLVNNGYIKAIKAREKVVSFPDFKELHNEIVDTQVERVADISKEQLIKIIQQYKIEKWEKGEAPKKTGRQPANKPNTFKNVENIKRNAKHACIIGIIHSDIAGKPICGYVLYHNKKEYTISKKYGIQLAEESKLENAWHYINKYSDILAIEGGNRNIPKRYKDDNTVLIESLTELESANAVARATSRIVGCIFNQIGKIIGLIVRIGGKEYNVQLTKIDSIIDRYKIPTYCILTCEQAEMYKGNYNISAVYMRGQEIYKKLNIISPHMTPDISIEIYGKDKTIVVNDGIDYGNIELRKKVIKEAIEIEERLLRRYDGIKLDKSGIEIVARVLTDNVKRQSPVESQYYVVKHSGKYYIMRYNNIMKCCNETNTSNLTEFITIWDREIKHRFYTDGNYLIAGLTQINKVAKEGKLN